MVKNWRTKLQIKKVNPKMGFWRAKHGLSKHGLKRPKLVSILGGANREGGKRREEEDEEEEKPSKPRYGTLDYCMETNLDYGFYEIWHGSLGLYDDYLISKSRVLIELYPKLRFLEIKVG